jgi:hypothetical protein
MPPSHGVCSICFECETQHMLLAHLCQTLPMLVCISAMRCSGTACKISGNCSSSIMIYAHYHHCTAPDGHTVFSRK